MNILKILLLFPLLSIGWLTEAQKPIVPINLKCELLTDPIGIDLPNPGLSYYLSAPTGNQKNFYQSAYQIQVSVRPDFKDGSDLWDTKKVASSQMAFIPYAGKVLESGQQCWWKVRVWDQKGVVSPWSKPSRWVMGVMDQKDWKAKWISADGAEKYAHPYKTIFKDFSLKANLDEMRQFMPRSNEPNFSSILIRKQFQLKGGIRSAVIHISGLGQYELTVNGTPVNRGILSPGWTDYKKTVLYDSYEITQKLKSGENVVGVILGNSLYNIQPDSLRYVKFLNTYGPLKLIANLVVHFGDGTVETFGTDENWQVSPGPITYSNYYAGEDFDKRLDPTGWDMPGFKPKKNWQKAVLSSSPGGKLIGLSGAADPIKKITTLKPIKVVQIRPDLFVYDLGQNAAIMPEIKIEGDPGSFVRIIPSELIKEDGTVDRTSATQGGVRPAWWQYTIASNKSETWFPKFFYQGGRYLQVEVFPAPGKKALPVVKKIEGVVVHSSAKPIGTFSCSNELFNRIYRLVRWAQRSNMMSVMTDCPQREKLGWLEQYHLNGPSLRYNFDLLPMFRKIMNDMADSQLSNGLVPNIAPEYFYASSKIQSGFRNSPEWGSAFIIVPWQQYLFSGDTTLLNQYYDRMKEYVSFLEGSAKDNLIPTGLGDWYDIGPKPAWGSQLTPVPFTGTAIYYYDCQIMAKTAKLLAKTADADNYVEKAAAIKESFNKTFFDPVKMSYATGSNTTLAMPLFFDLAETQYRKKLIEKLVSDIRNAGNAFTSGEVGYRFLLSALAREGYSDLIYDMNNQSDKPGYGYQLKMGATALTEKWDAGVGNFGSQNHFMSGQINEWFFNDLIGIRPEEDTPGFRSFSIKAAFLKKLSWVKGSYASISGDIKCAWKRVDGQLLIDLVIPANTIATLYLPIDNVDKIGGINKIDEVKLIGKENGSSKYVFGSGSYHLSIKEDY